MKERIKSGVRQQAGEQIGGPGRETGGSLVRQKAGEHWHEPVYEQVRGEGDWDCLRIGFAGLTAGAGASLLTICAAGYFSDRKRSVSVVELGGGGIYDCLAMDKLFALKEFHSFYKAAEGSGSLRRLSNLEQGVNWALKLPDEREAALEYREALRLIYGISGQAVLFDFSGREDEELWRLLREMDLVITVVDPLPQRLIAGRSSLEHWKLSGLPVRFLVNKACRGIDWRELTRFLKVKEVEQVPFLSPELLYAAQYAGRNPWEIEELQTQLQPVFDRLFAEYC